MLVQHRGSGSATAWTRYVYAHHPFDVVGWDGCLYPYVFSIHDFEPITGRLHQPPPVHQTFEGPNFVVCSFVPRLFDYHPDGIPAPYNHANVDSDEVIFYTGGDFMSRKGAGIEQGSISLHPSGFTHGPQPGSVEASIGKAATDELAVMVDTFRPLDLLRSGAGLRGHVVRLDLGRPQHRSQRSGGRLHHRLRHVDQRRRPLRRRRAGTTNSTTSTTSAMRISRVSTGPPSGRRSTGADRLTDPESPLLSRVQSNGRTTMFGNTKAFSGFAVDDIERARSSSTPRRSVWRSPSRTGC